MPRFVHFLTSRKVYSEPDVSMQNDREAHMGAVLQLRKDETRTHGHRSSMLLPALRSGRTLGTPSCTSRSHTGSRIYRRQPRWSAEDKSVATTAFKARASCYGTRTVGDAGGRGREHSAARDKCTSLLFSGLADPERSPCSHTGAATFTRHGPVEGGTCQCASEIWTDVKRS